MPERRTPTISSRKQPKQARSTDLVSTILEAATQVLQHEGATRFTTARVAERAGVSVGSLYQYFPNKAAILFRLQSDEWRQTTEMLRRILEDRTHPPQARLRRLVHAFIQSECDEAQTRGALNDAAPLYRDAPEAKEAREFSETTMRNFMKEALPKVPAPRRQLANDLIGTTLSAAGRDFSSVPRNSKEIAAYADAVSDMFCAYLDTLASAKSTRR